ncbi:MAG: LysM peptidoglycan-binding domain-containing protein [Actinomycetota bacterium]|nr:LysM peptidoglycan-binding domain-containing protein [Rubrobacter sp.]MDQ3508305.1 LysM peptidoglycan-binding domain-containing protein [Actinomycetota bacterium]
MENSEKYRRRRAGAVVVIAAVAFFLHAAAGADAESESELHSVRPGDTLWEIATENYPSTDDPRVTVEEIRAENGLDGYTIRPGEVLELPDWQAASEADTDKREVERRASPPLE